jgi:hypothetical protein
VTTKKVDEIFEAVCVAVIFCAMLRNISNVIKKNISVWEFTLDNKTLNTTLENILMTIY